MAIHNDHYALVVGIDDYPDFNSLNGAKNDAKAFAKWLKDKKTGGGVAPNNLKTVLSNKSSVYPIQDHIDEALKSIIDLAKKNEDAKRLYIYFSGHGVAHTAFSTNLCLATWSKRRTGAALDSMNYLECSKEMGVFREIIMFLDCCRTRTRGRNALPYQFPPISPGENASLARTFLGYATEYMLAAHEAAMTEPTGILVGKQTEEIRGHFTTALIEGLEGGAARVSGGVTASDLKNYLEKRTSEIAKSANHNQKPEVQNGLVASTEAVFGSAKPKTTTNVSICITFGVNRSGQMAFEDGYLTIIKQGMGTSSPWLIHDLKPGNYAIVDINKNDFKAVRILGNEQEVINVKFD